MLAIRWTALNELRYEDLPVPTAGPGEVLVRVRSVGVCGTDLHLYHYGYTYLFPGVILGHEFSGDVAALGSGVSRLAVGQRVVVEPSLPCGQCDLCREGRFNLCRDFRHLGEQIDGAFTEYLVMPERNVYPLPDSISYDIGALIEPVACGVHALDRVGVQAGQTAVLIGDGFFGLLFLQLLRLSGVTRIAVLGHHAKRLELARRLGADLVLDTREVDPRPAVAQLAGARGIDLCCEVAGNSAAVNLAVDLLRPGGRILLFSGYRDLVQADFQNVVGKELELIAANASPNVWSRTIDLIERTPLHLEEFVTGCYPLDRLAEAFAAAEDRANQIKIVVHP